MRKYNDTNSIVRIKPEKNGQAAISGNNTLQKKCRTCGKGIDFDYKKCPHCKGWAE